MQDPFKPDMTENEILIAVKQYKRFLNLKIKYPNLNLVPTDDIDMIWHAHILDTEQYAKDCANLFGTFLHHNPFSESMEMKLKKRWGPCSKKPLTCGFKNMGELEKPQFTSRCEVRNATFLSPLQILAMKKF